MPRQPGKEAGVTLGVVHQDGGVRVENLVSASHLEAQEMLQKTITPQIIRLRTLEKWDGKMPEVYGGGNGDFIIDVMRK